MNPMSGRGIRSKPVWRLLILRPPQRPREAESRKADTSNQRWRCSLKELRLGAARPNVINVQTEDSEGYKSDQDQEQSYGEVPEENPKEG